MRQKIKQGQIAAFRGLSLPQRSQSSPCLDTQNRPQAGALPRRLTGQSKEAAHASRAGYRAPPLPAQRITIVDSAVLTVCVL
ncbi:MAG: hypothetical protein LBO67_00400 [Spirochaetaceae bacterium]|nr:hypothetical protein [Spirochaetaceae bacterium]